MNQIGVTEPPYQMAMIQEAAIQGIVVLEIIIQEVITQEIIHRIQDRQVRLSVAL